MTLCFFHHVYPQPSDLLISTDAASLPRAQTQHLLITCSLGLPGTCCGVKWISRKSWRSNTGFMLLAGQMGKSWLRTAGFDQTQFRGGEREGGQSRGMLWPALHLCIPMTDIQVPPNHAHPGPGSFFKSTPLSSPNLVLVMSFLCLDLVNVLSQNFNNFSHVEFWHVFVIFIPRSLDF